MSLMKQFEDSEKEVYQVTCQEWLNIMQDQLVNICNRSIEEFKVTDTIEIKCFHKSQVEGAIRRGIEVPEIVLKDYPGIKEKIEKEVKAKQDKINSIPLLTQEIYNTLQEGNKITVNGLKLTVYRKDQNSIIGRIYRKQKQALELLIGERYNLVIGWS